MSDLLKISWNHDSTNLLYLCQKKRSRTRNNNMESNTMKNFTNTASESNSINASNRYRPANKVSTAAANKMLEAAIQQMDGIISGNDAFNNKQLL